jgi:methyltransferase (TIGR00027 family)
VKPNLASSTADTVAAIRAAHCRYDRPVVFDDPLAIHLTSRRWRLIVNNPVLYRLVIAVTGTARARGNFPARARYVEEKLERAVLGGIDQYVILGAGLDSFAWRRSDLAKRLRIFELDHPLSQQVKRDRLVRLGLSPPANLEWVAVDLVQESVAAALARSKYRRDARGFFSLVGTVQYLPREAVISTLRSIAATAAPGSELVLTYVQPKSLVKPAMQPVFDRLVLLAARKGEPFISLFDPEKFPSAVCALGYDLVENCAPHETALRYFAGRTDDLQPGAQWLSYIAHFRVSAR